LRAGKLFAGEKCRYVGAETNDAAIVFIAAGTRPGRRATSLFVTRLVSGLMARLVTRFLARFLPGGLGT